MKQGMIPIFVPHIGCPHICVFCNQHRITNVIEEPTGESVWRAIQEYLQIEDGEFQNKETRHKKWEVAFYGGSFTAICIQKQKELLAPAKEALDRGWVDGIRCSTRPDAITEESVNLLKQFGVSVVELGVQSMNDRVLQLSERGHTSQDVVQAVCLLKEKGFQVGIQLMPGLPGDTEETVLETMRLAGELDADIARIYPVLVIEGTTLADMYARGEYTPLSMERAIDISATMKAYLEARGRKVIRTGLQATDTLEASFIAGPYSPSFGEEVDNEIIWRKLYPVLKEIVKSEGACAEVIITYPRKYTSKVRGVKNKNVKKAEALGMKGCIWKEDAVCGLDAVHIQTKERMIKISLLS